MKNQRGITLIALVITIIVLLILAGVSIAMLTSENGILKRATEAGEKTTKGEVEEAIKLGLNEILTNKLDPTYEGTEDKITSDNVQNAIKRNNSNIADGDISLTYEPSSGSTEETVTISWKSDNEKEYKWEVDTKGQVKETTIK